MLGFERVTVVKRLEQQTAMCPTFAAGAVMMSGLDASSRKDE